MFVFQTDSEDGGESMFVCVAFGVEDNVKKCCNGDMEDLAVLKYAGLSLDKLVLHMAFKHVSQTPSFFKDLPLLKFRFLVDTGELNRPPSHPSRLTIQAC